MGELAQAIAEKCGNIVQDPKEADTIFCVNADKDFSSDQRVITAKDQDIWMGEFMSPSETIPQEKAAETLPLL